MSIIYIREQGAVVRREGERIKVTQGEKTLFDLPCRQVEQVVLFGHVQLTSAAVALLLQQEIDVVYLSQRGKFRGRLVHTGSKFAQLRVAQLETMRETAVNLRIARQVVVGKLHNQRYVLQENLDQVTAQSGGPPPPVERVGRSIRRIYDLLQKAQRATSPDSLRGFEGSAGAHYWAAFRALLSNDFGFSGRRYFPPPDPVNALLSFGYSLLLKDVVAAIQVVGLDPYLGFFHTIEYGRPSLALDLMEEFRPILVDQPVLALVNEGHITASSFERTPNPKLPLRLTETGLVTVIDAYETALNRQLPHADAVHPAPVDDQTVLKDGSGKTSQRRIIELQVRRLARVIQGQRRRYEPFRLG